MQELTFAACLQGSWVVLVAESGRAVGVDVAAPDQLLLQPDRPLFDQFASLPDCFSPAEVRFFGVVCGALSKLWCSLWCAFEAPTVACF